MGPKLRSTTEITFITATKRGTPGVQQNQSDAD
jgi:hypothetical protein